MWVGFLMCMFCLFRVFIVYWLYFVVFLWFFVEELVIGSCFCLWKVWIGFYIFFKCCFVMFFIVILIVYVIEIVWGFEKCVSNYLILNFNCLECFFLCLWFYYCCCLCLCSGVDLLVSFFDVYIVILFNCFLICCVRMILIFVLRRFFLDCLDFDLVVVGVER